MTPSELQPEQAPAAGHPLPRSPADLFWSFSAMALQGFGGVMAVAQNELVERRRWMTREEFIGDWAVAQVLPGPNMVNLSLMMGDRCFGLRGALAAMAGMLTFPSMLVLLLAALYSSVGSMPEVQGALRGMGAVIVSLIAVNAVKLAGDATKYPDHIEEGLRPWQVRKFYEAAGGFGGSRISPTARR